MSEVKDPYPHIPISLDDLHDEETRTTAASGGQKGTKITQVGALDPIAIMEVARVAGYGANKYEAFNYLRGFEYSKAYNAMMRHLNLFWAGEDVDPESGRLHLGHAAIEALFLISFHLRKIGTDDRPPRLPVEGAYLPEIERAMRLGQSGHLREAMRSLGYTEGQVDRVEERIAGTFAPYPEEHHAFVPPRQFPIDEGLACTPTIIHKYPLGPWCSTHVRYYNACLGQEQEQT